MTDQPDGVWRDEDKLSVESLSEAMATWDTDGQNDPTDNDAGEEQAFGHDAHPHDTESNATDPDREYRPSTTGRSGPH
ncbi:hypothetical protein [Actinoplanes sp. NPDC049265]|uniref:hypothetical protein n=1 Tax=Actinoplanes sp. NPDC049265 TaxID=3363902 RepID=UPI00371B6EC7